VGGGIKVSSNVRAAAEKRKVERVKLRDVSIDVRLHVVMVNTGRSHGAAQGNKTSTKTTESDPFGGTY